MNGLSGEIQWAIIVTNFPIVKSLIGFIPSFELKKVGERNLCTVTLRDFIGVIVWIKNVWKTVIGPSFE